MNIYFFNRNLVSGLDDLEELYLDNNNLHTIHMDAFAGTSMRVLHLQNNCLDFQNLGESSWDVERASPFQNLYKLKVLNMRNNSMKLFLTDWHTSNSALSELDLSNNHIEMIDFRIISNNWNDAIQINLSNNQIKMISADKHVIPIETNQSDIVWILNHNPLHCDCMVVHFANALRNQTHSLNESRMKFVTDKLECSLPVQFAKKRLENVPLSELTCPLDRDDSNDKLCPDRCSCFVRTIDSTAIFNCSNANHTTIPALPNIKNLGLQYYELHIENNNISTLITANTTGYKNVNRLFAKNNSMDKILTEHLPNNLFELDVSMNKLKRINPGVLLKLSQMRHLQNVSFGQNPWICDCATSELMNFIRVHFTKIVGINEITCDNDKSLTVIDAIGLCPIETKTILFILTAVIIAVFLLSTTLFYKNKQEIMVWLFAHKRFTWIFHSKSKTADTQKKYDAFILHSVLDEKFVTESLLPKLENGTKPLKICLLLREIQGGDIIPEQVKFSSTNKKITETIFIVYSIISINSKLLLFFLSRT